jgi:prepilin-type processing-associated H-X9-DG protein
LKQLGLSFAQYLGDNDSRYPHAWDANLPAASTATSLANVNAQLITTPANDPLIWPAKLEPYLKSRQIFRCPSYDYGYGSACATVAAQMKKERGWEDGDPVVDISVAVASGVYRGASQVEYGYNYVFLGGGIARISNSGCFNTDYTTGVGALESDLEVPAQTLLLVDSNYTNAGADAGPAFVANSYYAYSAGTGMGCGPNRTLQQRSPFDGRHFDGLNVLFCDGHVKWMRSEDVAYRPAGMTANCTAPWASSITDPKYIWNRF